MEGRNLFLNGILILVPNICVAQTKSPTSLSLLTKALSPGTTTIFCGPPGATKSFFTYQSVYYWYECGHAPAILELEDGCEYHAQRALAQRVGDSNLTDDDWIRKNKEQARAYYEREAAFLDHFGACVHTLPGDQQPTQKAIADWVEKVALSGKRVIVVDSISIAAISDRQYVDDQKFMIRIKRIAEQTETSIILIVHPKKHPQGVSLDDGAGGASYSRLCHTALWLEFHAEPKSVTVRDTTMGLNVEAEINRTLHIIKARNGRGTGKKIGFNFDGDTLRFTENGVIVTDK
ncbi:MAG: AAA family ATPase [Planctomycetes bacterium]|nr:AAA family ATPase [Planctomycetota bacterium]